MNSTFDFALINKVLDGVDMKASLIDKESSGSMRSSNNKNGKKKKEKPELAVLDHPGLGRVPKGLEGEQVAAQSYYTNSTTMQYIIILQSITTITILHLQLHHATDQLIFMHHPPPITKLGISPP